MKDVLNLKEQFADYLFDLQGQDTIIPQGLHEIVWNYHVIPVKKELWSAWTGLRLFNGNEHHGPVYVMGTTKLYTGARTCSCQVCWPDAPAKLKAN